MIFHKPKRKLSAPELFFVVLLVLGGLVYGMNNDRSSPASQPEGTQAVLETVAETSAPTAAPTLTLASTTDPTLEAVPTFADPPGRFDYFLLALSWSPDYCASGANDPQQCGLGKKLGFVLHGLWPQYNTGYPSSCGDEALPAEDKAAFPGLFPNDSLFEHEWSKHGTCTGLTPRAYFADAQQLRASVAIPAAFRSPEQPFRVSSAALKDQFIAANPDFSADGLAVRCSGSGRYLSEVYICFSKQGAPAACGADVLKSAAKSCALKDFLVRSTR